MMEFGLGSSELFELGACKDSLNACAGHPFLITVLFVLCIELKKYSSKGVAQILCPLKIISYIFVCLP